MSVPDRTGVPEKTSQTEQYVLNYSFDEVFKLLMVGLTAYNPATNSMDRVQVNSFGGIATTDAATSARYDLQSPVYYVGSAPVGADEGATIWNVIKYDTSSNPITAKTAQNITWTGRTGATYV